MSTAINFCLLERARGTTSWSTPRLFHISTETKTQKQEREGVLGLRACLNRKQLPEKQGKTTNKQRNAILIVHSWRSLEGPAISFVAI